MQSHSLQYLLRNLDGIGLSFQRPWALLLLLVVPAFFVFRRRLGNLPLALRIAAFALVVAVFAGAQITAPLPDRRTTYVVAIDDSDSIGANGREWARSWVEQLARSIGPEDDLGILSFAGDVRIVRPPAHGPVPLEEIATAPIRSATDLSRAIDTAMTLFGAGEQAHLLLITDGHETRGDSRRMLPRLKAAGVRIDAIIPPADNGPDLAVAKLALPPLVSEGQSFPLRFVVSNSGKPRPAVFSLMLDGLIIESTAVEIPAGTTGFAIPYTIEQQGSHRLRAQLEAEGDAFPANNAREVALTVGGLPRVLIVSSHERTALARVLERKNIRVDVRSPAEAPRSVDGLLAYRGVVAEDLTAAAVDSSFFEAVQEYVHDHGGGFLFVGGVGSFGDEGLKNTSLRKLLPVTLEPRRPRRTQREPLAIFLIIDRSNSMGYNSRIGTLRDGEKLRYAKEAALAVIRQLKDHDLVGVIAFDSQPWEISALRPLRETRRQLEEDIPRLIENGGTDFFDALVSGQRQLEESRVNRRHIVLLTDGDTNRADMDDYSRLLDEMAAGRISITTIRIGDDTVNLNLLQTISTRTGGEFHHVADAQELPELMLRDTTRALGPVHADEDRFYPRLGDHHQVLGGIAAKSIPALSGYAFARAKPGADAVLQIEHPNRRDPILAVWQHGLGRVAAFTASPNDDAEMWLAWDSFSKLWSQLMRWTIRGQGAFDYAVDARRSEGAVHLTVRAFGSVAPDGLLRGRLEVDETVHDIAFLPGRSREFIATLPAIPGGRYPLKLIRRTGQRVTEQTELVTIPDETTEPLEEQHHHQPNRPLLAALTKTTGGSIDANIRDVVLQKPGNRRLAYSLEWLLMPLAMLLFLSDVAIRKRAQWN